MAQNQEILTNLNHTIAQNPDDAHNLARRGETYRLMGCYQEALADFNRAVELKPGHAWTLAHRGLIYRLTHRHEAALADFDRAIALKPDYAWVIIQRGNSYVALRRFEDALADLDQAIGLNPAIIGHWRGERGLILNALGRYAEAIACCKQALQEDADDHVALYSLVVAKGRGCGLVGMPPEIEHTRALLQNVLQTVVDKYLRAGALYRLGGLAALEGKRDPALAYLRQALPLDPEPGGIAQHDPAWLDLRADPDFQLLVTENI